MCSCNMKKAKREKKVYCATRIHPSCVHSSWKQLLSERGRGILCDEQVNHVCRTTVFFSFISLQDHSYYCYSWFRVQSCASMIYICIYIFMYLG
jgi:hypothetical protein